MRSDQMHCETLGMFHSVVNKAIKSIGDSVRGFASYIDFMKDWQNWLYSRSCSTHKYFEVWGRGKLSGTISPCLKYRIGILWYDLPREVEKTMASQYAFTQSFFPLRHIDPHNTAQYVEKPWPFSYTREISCWLHVPGSVWKVPTLNTTAIPDDIRAMKLRQSVFCSISRKLESILNSIQNSHISVWYCDTMHSLIEHHPFWVQHWSQVRWNQRWITFW